MKTRSTTIDRLKVFLGSGELCARVARGDESAFQELLARHEREIQAWGSYGNCKADADEIVQNIRICLWRKAHQFRGQSKFSSWFYTLCRCEAGMWYRVYKAKLNHVEVLEEHWTQEASQERLANFRSVARQVNRRFRLLSQREQEVIRLTHIDDLTPTEISNRVGKSVQCVKSLIHRGRYELRDWVSVHAREAVNF